MHTLRRLAILGSVSALGVVMLHCSDPAEPAATPAFTLVPNCGKPGDVVRILAPRSAPCKTGTAKMFFGPTEATASTKDGAPSGIEVIGAVPAGLADGTYPLRYECLTTASGSLDDGSKLSKLDFQVPCPTPGPDAGRDGPTGPDSATLPPDGEGALGVGGPSIPGSIDARDMDVRSFDPMLLPSALGDEYGLPTSPAQEFVIGIKALTDSGRANIIDYVLEVRSDKDPRYLLDSNTAMVGGNECVKVIAPDAVAFQGSWTIRVLTYHGLPTEAALEKGSSLYRIKAEAGSVCNFDSY